MKLTFSLTHQKAFLCQRTTLTSVKFCQLMLKFSSLISCTFIHRTGTNQFALVTLDAY